MIVIINFESSDILSISFVPFELFLIAHLDIVLWADITVVFFDRLEGLNLEASIE